MLDQVIEFVNESFSQGVMGAGSIPHFERALYWVKQLKPDADEAIQIAVYAHDIQRAFRTTNTEDTFKDKEFNDPEFLEEHQKKGAEIITAFLRERGYKDLDVTRVYNMVRYHEEGGDRESDLVKDADSLSYFEMNLLDKHYVKDTKDRRCTHSHCKYIRRS